MKSENGAIPAKKEGNFLFLHLPTEIRNLIYHYVMIDKNAIHGTEAPSGRMIGSFCGSLCPWLQSLYLSRPDGSLRATKARTLFQQIEEIIHNSPSSEFSYTTICLIRMICIISSNSLRPAGKASRYVCTSWPSSYIPFSIRHHHGMVGIRVWVMILDQGLGYINYLSSLIGNSTCFSRFVCGMESVFATNFFAVVRLCQS